jgi:hypothetical protein
MNTGGFDLENFHNGDTTIDGNLTISGNITIGASSGQSEYLDSGDYTDFIIIRGSQWTSLGLQPSTNYRYAKNGNIVQIYLALTGLLNAGTSSTFPQFEVSIPGIDLFGTPAIVGAYTNSRFNLPAGQQFNCFDTQVRFDVPSQRSAILFFFTTASASYLQQTTNFYLTATYKLDGDDIPATALIVGGGGGSGVQNPMLTSLNGGGFNLLNFGDISATTFNGGVILTNPLNVQFNANNQNIINLNELKVNQILSNTPGSAIQITEDISMNEKKIFQLERLENKGQDLTIATGSMILSATNLNMNTNNITGANDIKVNQILSNTIGVPLSINESVTMNNKNINDVNEMKLNVLRANASGSDMQIIDNMAMNNKNISGANTITTNIFNTKSINGLKYVFVKADLPQFLSGVYIICDYIVLDASFTYTVANDTTFIGYGRENAGLIFTNPTNDPNQSCIVVNNRNVSFINLRFGNQSSTFSLLNCTNVAKDKNLNFINCYFAGCKNRSVIKINGFDLVDFSNVVFEFNFPTIDQLLINGAFKTQISNCTFYKQNSDGGGVIGTAPMLELGGTSGAISVHGCIFEPQETQDGVRIDGGIVTPILMITGNTFNDAGLTTGQLLNYVQNGTFMFNNNSGIIDNRAILSAVSTDNKVYTSTIIAQYVTVDFGPGFVVLESNRFALSLSPFTFIYNARQPIYVQVNANITADHSTGGTDVLLFALLKNNVPVSILQVSVVSNTASTFGYNAVFQVSFGDSLKFAVQNQTAGTDNLGFRAIAFNGSLSQV